MNKYKSWLDPKITTTVTKKNFNDFNQFKEIVTHELKEMRIIGIDVIIKRARMESGMDYNEYQTPLETILYYWENRVFITEPILIAECIIISYRLSNHISKAVPNIFRYNFANASYKSGVYKATMRAVMAGGDGFMLWRNRYKAFLGQTTSFYNDLDYHNGELDTLLISCYTWIRNNISISVADDSGDGGPGIWPKTMNINTNMPLMDGVMRKIIVGDILISDLVYLIDVVNWIACDFKLVWDNDELTFHCIPLNMMLEKKVERSLE